MVAGPPVKSKNMTDADKLELIKSYEDFIASLSESAREHMNYEHEILKRQTEIGNVEKEINKLRRTQNKDDIPRLETRIKKMTDSIQEYQQKLEKLKLTKLEKKLKTPSGN